jgi:hypothetical protein
MERNLRLIAITLVAGGCTAAPLGSGGAPTTGIYQLTESRSGSCTPALADDTISAYVDGEHPGSPLLYMSGPWFGPPGIGMSEMAIVLEHGSATLQSNYCNAELHREFVLDDAEGEHVHAHHVDTFTGVAGPQSAPCLTGALPAADCTQTIELDYVLTQPCPKECIQSGEPLDPSSFRPSIKCSC